MKLAVVMPVYNEEECIQNVIASWYAKFSILTNDDFTFLAINDGSKDNSLLELQNLAEIYPHLKIITKDNEGHGPTVLRGYREAISLGPEWIFQMDSDNQFFSDDFDLLWNRREESTFILGKRENRQDPFPRLVVTRILKLLIFIFFLKRVKDPNIPFRLLKTETLKSFVEKLTSDYFAPNIYLSLFAKKEGIDTIDIPVQHVERKSGENSISIKNLFKITLKNFVELLKFRFLNYNK